MKKVTENVISFEEHPLVAHKITKLRDINTGSKEFGEIITELTILMGYEALSDLKTKMIEVEAPLTTMESLVLDETFTIIPILRAGLGMVEGLKTLLPTARVGHVGLYRDQETLEPVTYYYKMPENVEGCPAIIVDPALATGGSIDATIDYLKKDGFEKIKVMSIFTSDVGATRLLEHHPDVQIYTAQYIPGGLNEDGFIVTAAGDIGDRINGTFGYRNAKPAKP